MKPKKSRKGSTVETESLGVYCRVRPIDDDADSCITVDDDETVVLREQESRAVARGSNAIKESSFKFTYVFDQDVGQRELFDHIGLPLVGDLIRGKNALLMTYGVTSSGKTFTMNGKPSDSGILPRSLDVLFNSVGNLLAHKCVFKPDKQNGFEIQSEADAITERQKLREAGFRGSDKLPSRAKSDLRHRISDARKCAEVEDDNVYGIFISYLEIYNDYIYDLLDDSVENSISRERSSKKLREDQNRNMFVSGACEVEVDSVEEAFFWLNKGQNRRRLADTMLNRESSRSHAVFRIRLVQAPAEQDNEPVNDKSCLLVSQLCLVDLAGSERLVRTKATGSRLNEAKSINSSLMVLKNCIDALRENQRNSADTRMVPYRDSKMTHLFRNFFEGNGMVRMICCINPNVSEYDENLHVLNFAESCREIELPTEADKQAQLRKRANKVFETSLHKLTSGLAPAAKRHCTWTYPNFPFVEPRSAGDPEFFNTLTEHLSEVETLRGQYWSYYESGYDELIGDFDRHDEENIALSSTVKDYEDRLQSKSRQVSNLEGRIKTLEKKLARAEAESKELRIELTEKETQIEKDQQSNLRQIKELKSKLKYEKDVAQRELAARIKECNASWQMKWEIQSAKWKNLKEMVNKNGDLGDMNQMNELFCTPEPGPVMEPDENIDPAPSSRIGSTTSEKEVFTPASSKATQRTPHTNTTSTKPFRVKQRRSRSVPKWIEHKDADMIKTGTVFKSSLKNKKTVTAAPTLKDMKKQSNYLLHHQELDTDGEIEERLYKGDILPTRSGGSQIEFNDVETLKTKSPAKVVPHAPPPPSARPLDDSAINQCPSIQQRKEELQRQGLYTYRTGISGHPSGATPAIQSSVVSGSSKKSSHY